MIGAQGFNRFLPEEQRVDLAKIRAVEKHLGGGASKDEQVSHMTYLPWAIAEDHAVSSSSREQESGFRTCHQQRDIAG